MLKLDAWLFVGIFVALFLVWVFTGGPTRPISWAGPFLNPPAPLGNGKAYFLSGAGFTVGDSSTHLAGFTVGSNSAHEDTSGYFENPSPYRGVVNFDSNPSDAEQPVAANQLVDIQVASDAKSPIDISGWQLVSNNARWNIPQGSVVPVDGMNRVSDIMLNAGDDAVINTGSSPIGVSYRENSCTSYLDQAQSYNQCVADQSQSPNFAGTAWHIYLGSQSALWGNAHDTIRLLDVQGRTVDVFSY